MFIAQTSGLHHFKACCLVSLETEFQFRDAFSCTMTVKVPEHVISELLDSDRADPGFFQGGVLR